MPQIHATCVAISGQGVLIRGPSGSGKSDLALRLIDEGADLVADDYCNIAFESGRLIATPPPAIAGKLEVRGIGILQMPHTNIVAIRLVVDLRTTQEIERLPETATTFIENVPVPWISIDPRTASATAKVRVALSSLA